MQRLRDASSSNNTAPRPRQPPFEELEVFQVSSRFSQGGLGSVALCYSVLLQVTGLELSFQNCLVKTLPAGNPAKTSSLWNGIRIMRPPRPFPRALLRKFTPKASSIKQHRSSPALARCRHVVTSEGPRKTLFTPKYACPMEPELTHGSAFLGLLSSSES